MRWWGWGLGDRRIPLAPSFERWLSKSLELDGAVRAPVELDTIALGPSALAARARERLEACVGPGWVRGDDVTRISHSAGKSYLDLVRMRAGTPQGAVDARRLSREPRGGAGGARRVRRRARRGRAVRRRHEHRRGPRAAARRPGCGDRARPRARRGDPHRRWPLAHGQRRRRHARAGARGGARRARPHARPLPRQLRVRLGRRLRGDALGRTGLERVRAHRPGRPGRAARDPARRALLGGAPRERGGPGAARAARGLRGRARRDHRPAAARAHAPRAPPLRGRRLRRLPDRRRGDAHRGAGSRDARRRADHRRAADEPADGGGRIGRPAGSAGAPVPAQPPRRAGDRRLGGPAATRSTAGACTR